MTVEELLKPRYKVIAPYPGSEFRVNDILVFIPQFMHRRGGKPGSETYSDVFKSGNSILFAWEITKYPHLFRLMHWSEERKPEDMPKYVKYIGNGRVSDMAKGMVEYGLMVLEDYFPATESEYLEYINSQTPQQ